jgi:hypothetical protein
MASGFTGTVGNLALSNFNFYTNLLTPSSIRNANLPGSILVTPQSSAGLDGLAFTNMGVYFSGNMSNTSSSVIFTATALSGLITGDSVVMTNYSATGTNGEAFWQMYDGSNALPTATVNCFNCSSPPSLTNSQTFAGIGSTPIYVNAAAVNTGFSGGARPSMA